MVGGDAASDAPIWCFDALIEYDELHLYIGGPMTPFSEKIDDVIPLHHFGRLRQDVHPAFLSALRDHEARGLPEHASVWTEEVLGAARPGESSEMVSWLSFEEILNRLGDRRLNPEELDLGSQVLLDTMDFLASELGRERVRLVFRLSRKV